jgi:peptidoglycan hydrolase CwlO-like protein
MPRRLFAAIVGFALLASAGGAVAQIQAEADKAAAQVDEAAGALAEAETQRAVLLDDLVAAVDQWRHVVEGQTAVAFDVAELRDTVAEHESAAAELRDAIRARVVDAYMTGGVGLLDTFVVADSFTDVATAEFVLDAITRSADDDLEELRRRRRHLDELREELMTEEALLATRNEEIATMVDELDILFADADSAVAASHEALLAADAEYREAYQLLQEMLALQRAVGQGTERWRSIVEHYFPAERVEQALEVMWCESRGNPKATHPLSDAAGLFQFMEGTWEWVAPQAGYGGASRYDPEANIAGAAWLLNWSIEKGHRLGAWGRWTCQPTTQVP